MQNKIALGDIYYWQPSAKAILLSAACFILHSIISLTICFIYIFKPEELTMTGTNLLWSLVISSFNGLLMLSALSLAIASRRMRRVQGMVLIYSLACFVLSTALMMSFTGFFEGLSWLIFFLFNSALFIFIDRKVVVATFSLLLTLMIFMTFVPEVFPFPIRALRYVPHMTIGDISYQSRIIEWTLLSITGASGVILLDFLLSAWRTREEDLRSKSYVDELTGVMNRRAILESLNNEYRRARRAEYPLAVAMIDLDHFKKINDNYGHPFGDVVLKGFGELISEVGRRNDLVGRYGGEEFLMVFPECDIDDATRVIENLRKKMLITEFYNEAKSESITVTLSAGVSQLESFDLHGSELISRADFALYEAKRAGRNMILAAEYSKSEDELGEEYLESIL